jgi:hypothetical protein
MRSAMPRRCSLAPVRLSRSFAATVALFLATLPAHAEEPDTTAAFFTGASVFIASFGVGGVLLGSTLSDHKRDNVGWLTIESGFTLAPLAAHAVAGEWARGAVFAAPPAVATVGTGVLFGYYPNAVRHGRLPEQRVMWTLFGAGLFVSIAGIVDATFADKRYHSLTVTPAVGKGECGLEIGGTL